MIAPEYFNNHVSVEGEIIVKSVPNDAGFVLVWNPTTKKISRRTHAEIAADLGVLTESSLNNITGKKWFKTDGGNTWDNNSLRIQGINGHDAGLTFFRDGIDVGQLIFDGYFFHTKTADGVGYLPIKSSHFIKNGSDANYVLLGNGDHKAISDFALNSQLSNYVTINTPQEIEARKILRPGTGNRYDEASLELRGSNASSVYPTISFHQPGLYAGTISLRNSNQFSFRNTDDSDFNYLLAKGYIKSGSDNSYLLLGGGDHKSVSDFALSTDLTGYVRTTGDQNIDGIKGFTGAYTQWILNGDGSNARGFVQSLSSRFGLGTLNDKDAAIYRNAIEKITLYDENTNFLNRVQAPFITIIQKDTSRYGSYVGLEVLSPDENAIYAGGVADTVGSYIGQSKYITSNLYQSNKSYASFIRFGNAGDIVFYGDVGLATNTNYSPSEIAKIDNGGRLKINSVVINGGNSTQFLKADGSLDDADYATSAQLGNYHNIDFTGSINNGSDTHTNKTWFDYNWAGTGGKGSVINFSGLNGNYSTEIFSDYLGGNAIGVRTKNGDAGVWNDTKWIWHSGNFTQGDINNWNSAFNNQGNYWDKSSTAGYVGINASTPFSVLNNGYAQKVYMGGLLVSDAYQDEGNVPANGAYIKGQISTGSHGNSAEWKTAYNWGDHKEVNTGQYLGNTGQYTIDSNTSVNSFPHGIASYFVQADSVYPSYGSLLNIKTYSGGGGTLQLYTPYSNQYGGDFIKYRRYNYGTEAWTEMRGFWDTGHFSITDISNWNQAFNWGNHTNAGYITQSALNSQLGSYATLNGVQTFANTNTFLQSPVIPNGTINNHAVNLGQLYYNDRTFITDSRGAVRPPSFYDDRFAQWDFQHGSDTQVTGDAWQGVLTISKWETFDPSHRQEQILFTGDDLKRRTAIDDNTWGPEKTIWDSGNFTPANFATTSQLNDKVNKSGDTMSGALNITSNHKIGDWRGTTQTGNYLSWLKYDGSKAIAYIGADGGSAIGNGGTGDNFVITSAGGGDLILSSSSGTIQANGQINTTNHGNSSQWQNTSQYALMNRGATFTSNVDADQISQGTEIISIELPNGSGNTNFPFHDYGTFMRFRANSFTTDFAHAHNGNLWFKNFYHPNGAAGATWRMVWDTQNFNPDSKVNKSGDSMSGALLIGNNNIGKQRVLHLAEPTLLDSYGFNFYTDTSTGLLTLHGLNNGLNNAVPILSANRANNFIGINKENPASELDVNGYVASNGFIKNNSSDDYFLMGGGGQLTKYSKDDAFVNSGRDFPDGTLITTDIDYSQTQGDSFLLEIKGNMYGGGLPMDTKIQGYIYEDTIINQSGYSTYSDLTTIIAMNINGNLCFWFPRLWYWQGFSVKVITTGGGDITTVNRVISIDNSPEPAGTKHVKIAIYTLSTQSWVNNQGFLTSANLNGYVTQSSLNNQLGNYATLNGVQTFNNTNTFNQSPVIPNGTIGNHAVNLNQLLDVAPPYYWNYVGHSAIANRRVLSEMTWNNYGNNHTIFDISSGTTPWGASKSNVDAEQPWSPSYPTLVGGNGSGTYGVRVDSARNADNLGGISAGSYATQTWVDTNYIPKSHPVYNITQANINSWNAGTGGGSTHNHSNLFYLNNIDQYLGTGQAPQFGSIRLMDSLGYGMLALEEGFIGEEIGLVDTSNKRFYAGRINEYLKYGSSIDGFEGLNMHFDAQLLGIGREIGNDEDKVQLAGDLSVDTIDIGHNSTQLILNPLYNTDGDVRRSRNAHIYIVTRNMVSLPDKPIFGQRIEIFNDSDNYIEVTHGNVGTMFHVPPYCKVTGIAANKGFKFDAKPVETKQYDI